MSSKQRYNIHYILSFASTFEKWTNLIRVFSFHFICSTVNCWPSQNGEGGCDVNIEYELEHQQLELQDLKLSIPLP